MNKERYEVDEQTGEILDNHFVMTPEDIVDRLNYLEEQLKNSRVKYFIGFDSDFNVAVKEMDLNIILPKWMHDKEFKFYDTKEEAEAKFKELQGDYNGRNSKTN